MNCCLLRENSVRITLYVIFDMLGNISHLWKVKEGLGDLHTVTYQYSAAVTYYKEALALIGIQSSRNVIRDQRRIVDKLTAVLDSQKNGGKRDIHISYNDRRPVVLPMSYVSSRIIPWENHKSSSSALSEKMSWNICLYLWLFSITFRLVAVWKIADIFWNLMYRGGQVGQFNVAVSDKGSKSDSYRNPKFIYLLAGFVPFYE